MTGQTLAMPIGPIRVSIVLAFLGLLVAGYLSYAELSGTSTVCPEGGFVNCDLVQSSAYAYLFGIPVSVLGVLGYLAILAVLVAESLMPDLSELSTMAFFAMALIGTLFSAYLTYVELFILHAICIWCVASAILMTALFGISVFRLRDFLKT